MQGVSGNSSWEEDRPDHRKCALLIISNRLGQRGIWYKSTYRVQNLNPNIPRAARIEAARGGGGAGPGRTGPRQNASLRRRASLVPSKASKTHFPNVSPEARTSATLCKPVGAGPRHDRTPTERFAQRTIVRRTAQGIQNTCPERFPTCRVHLSSSKPGHTTGESSRGARRGGGAGSGRTGRRQNSSPRRPSYPPGRRIHKHVS